MISLQYIPATIWNLQSADLSFVVTATICRSSLQYIPANIWNLQYTDLLFVVTAAAICRSSPQYIQAAIWNLQHADLLLSITAVVICRSFVVFCEWCYNLQSAFLFDKLLQSGLLTSPILLQSRTSCLFYKSHNLILCRKMEVIKFEGSPQVNLFSLK